MYVLAIRYADVFRGESKPLEPCPALTSLTQAARTVNYHRQTTRPNEPKDLDFEVDLRVISDDFLQGDIRTAGRRHLVFATDRQLETLSSAKTWYLDSTFRVVSKPFYQLLSIHTYLTSGSSTKQVPLLFALMSSRQTEDYIQVFKCVQTLLGGGENISVEKMVTDFEMATWKGFTSVFSGVPVKGCTFHLNQAIFRKVQDLGLACSYNNDDGTYRFVKKLMALQFLQEDHIRPSFIQLKGQASTEQLHQLCEYMENTWISEPFWRVNNWCVFGSSIRTNNDVEAWHKRINQKASRRNLPFYTLIPFLKKEADFLPLQVRLLTDGQLDRRQTTQQKQRAAKYFQLWDGYQEGELTPSQLLREVARINGPVQTPDE